MFDERRMFRIEAKVSSGKIRIPGSEMRGLIVCRGIGADEKDTLNKKNNYKDESRGEIGRSLEPRVAHTLQ